MAILFCIHTISLEHVGLMLSCITAIILLIWFCYSQHQSYTKNYFNEIQGDYAGFVESRQKTPDSKKINAGIIMHIRDVDNKGFFKGEFEFGESIFTFQTQEMKKKRLSIGIHTFLGKLNYRFYVDKSRHPLKIKENRVYTGKLYVIDRLDFPFDTVKMEQYLKLEYDIIHYREMKTLKFSLLKTHKELGQKIPESFTLYKSGGFVIEPLKAVSDIIF